jgi:hypothetical protein
MTNFITPNDLMSTEKGFSSSSFSGPSFVFNSFSIGDKSSVSTSDLISESLNKSDSIPALDRFLGKNNFVSSSRYHGQIVAYFKPHQLTLFDLAVLAQVVHNMHPRYTILGEQCYFMPALSILQEIFGISPSQSADEKKTLYTRLIRTSP